MNLGQEIAIADLSSTPFDKLPDVIQTDPGLVPNDQGITLIWAVKSAYPGTEPGTFRPLVSGGAYAEHARAVCRSPLRRGKDSRDHEAPALNCSCGFYAVRIGDDPPTRPGSIRLQVALSGVVVVHRRGYRAEVQTVVRPLEAVHVRAPKEVEPEDAYLVGRQLLRRAALDIELRREWEQKRSGPQEGSGQGALRPTRPESGGPGFALRLPRPDAELPEYPTPDVEFASPIEDDEFTAARPTLGSLPPGVPRVSQPNREGVAEPRGPATRAGR